MIAYIYSRSWRVAHREWKTNILYVNVVFLLFILMLPDLVLCILIYCCAGNV
jgi:hypothetical protein